MHPGAVELRFMQAMTLIKNGDLFFIGARQKEQPIVCAEPQLTLFGFDPSVDGGGGQAKVAAHLFQAPRFWVPLEQAPRRRRNPVVSPRINQAMMGFLNEGCARNCVVPTAP